MQATVTNQLSPTWCLISYYGVRSVSLHPVIGTHSREPTSDFWPVIEDKRILLSFMKQRGGNHCSACVISPQMNQDNGRAKWERRQFRLQRGNALSNRSACCDISVFNLPAVSIWMVSAHDFAHRAAVENCSSHSSDLSPAAKEKKLLKACLYWAGSSFCSVRGAFRPKWIACSCKGIQEQLGRKRATPGMQGEWHLLGTWGTTSLYVI